MMLIPVNLKAWDKKSGDSFEEYIKRMCRGATPEERQRIDENCAKIRQLHELIVSALRVGAPYLLHVSGEDLRRIQIALEEA